MPIRETNQNKADGECFHDNFALLNKPAFVKHITRFHFDSESFSLQCEIIKR